VAIRILSAELAALPVVRHQNGGSAVDETRVQVGLVADEQRQPGAGLALAALVQVDLQAVAPDDREVRRIAERVQ
jgi:hypothetical protein